MGHKRYSASHPSALSGYVDVTGTRDNHGFLAIAKAIQMCVSTGLIRQIAKVPAGRIQCPGGFQSTPLKWESPR